MGIMTTMEHLECIGNADLEADEHEETFNEQVKDSCQNFALVCFSGIQSHAVLYILQNRILAAGWKIDGPFTDWNPPQDCYIAVSK